jgi:uncharacterized membrane protein YfcA
MQNRLLVARIAVSVLAFLLAYALLDRAGASDYWTLAGAILAGLLGGQLAQRVVGGPRRRR